MQTTYIAVTFCLASDGYQLSELNSLQLLNEGCWIHSSSAGWACQI